MLKLVCLPTHAYVLHATVLCAPWIRLVAQEPVLRLRLSFMPGLLLPAAVLRAKLQLHLAQPVMKTQLSMEGDQGALKGLPLWGPTLQAAARWSRTTSPRQGPAAPS